MDAITDKRLREIVDGTYCGFDEGIAIAAELLAARAEVAEARRLDGVRLSQIASLQEIIRNDTTPAGVEVARFRAEVERLRAMLAGLCGAVEHSAPRYGVDEDWADIDTLRLRLDEAKALLAKHKDADQ